MNLESQGQGMTLSDWFAGQAMAGWLASFGKDMPLPGGSDLGAMSKLMYNVADSLLVEHNKHKEQSDEEES